MTYRHHAAKLIEVNEQFAFYSYTSETLDEDKWGIIKFSISEPQNYKVVRYCEDDGSEKWKESVCMALSTKFRKSLIANNGEIPKSLMFVA